MIFDFLIDEAHTKKREEKYKKKEENKEEKKISREANILQYLSSIDAQ